MKPGPAITGSSVEAGVPLRATSPLWRRMLRLLGRQLFRLAENNDDPRFDRNGEQWLLRELLRRHARSRAERPFVVFDAGANVGNYTRQVLGLARATGSPVVMHLFEPSPHCVALLREAFADEPAVRVIGVAVGEVAGQALLFDGGLGSSQASLVPRDVLSGASDITVAVPMISLGDYMHDEGVGRVDFLKLDVEGSELAALRGLGTRLGPRSVKTIQLEYGGATRDAGVTLRALERILRSHGYAFAKLFPRSLEERPYREWMDNYSYANYVAVASEREGLSRS